MKKQKSKTLTKIQKPKTKPRPGRPVKINEEIIKHIEYVVSLGMPQKMAAFYVGIDPTTLVAWRHQGEQDIELQKDSMYSKLVIRIKKAIALSMKDRLENIRKAEKESWQCSAWILERRFPEFFGKDILIHDMNDAGIDMNKNINELEEAEIDTLIHKIKIRIEDKKKEYIQNKKYRAIEYKSKGKK